MMPTFQACLLSVVSIFFCNTTLNQIEFHYTSHDIIEPFYIVARPPFIPTVTSQDDCSNFDDFEILKEAPKLDDFKTKRDFSGKDLPFIGFTYTKPLPGTERYVYM